MSPIIIVIGFVKIFMLVLSPRFPGLEIPILIGVAVLAIVQILIAEKMGLGYMFFVALIAWVGSLGMIKMFPEAFAFWFPIVEVVTCYIVHSLSIKRPKATK